MRILGIDPGYAIVGYGVIEYKNNHFSNYQARKHSYRIHPPQSALAFLSRCKAPAYILFSSHCL